MDGGSSAPLEPTTIGSSEDRVWPLVTIGLPVFNGQETIKRAVGSLISQRYPNIEIVISDNASTDKTVHICRRVLRDHPNARVIEQPENRGPHANFEAVVKEAHGKYFMWAADDDIWKPDFVSRLVEELETHPDACVAMTATELRTPAGERIDVIRFKGTADPNGLPPSRLGALVLTPRKYNYFIYGLYRTQIIQQGIRTFPAVLGGDRMFVAQFAIGHRWRYVDEVLYLRTDQPAHRSGYKREEAKAEVRLGQVSAFARMMADTQVLPWWRKLTLPFYTAVYAGFVYRKQITAAADTLRAYGERLPRALSPASVILAAAAAVGTGVLAARGAAAAPTAVLAGTAALSFLAVLVLQRRSAATSLDAVRSDLSALRKIVDRQHDVLAAQRHSNRKQLDAALAQFGDDLRQTLDADLGGLRERLDRNHDALGTLRRTSSKQLDVAFAEFRAHLRLALDAVADQTRQRTAEDIDQRLASTRPAIVGDVSATFSAALERAVDQIRQALEQDRAGAFEDTIRPALADLGDMLRTRVAEDQDSHFRDRIRPTLAAIADQIRLRVGEDAQARLEHLLGPLLSPTPAAGPAGEELGRQLDQIGQEVKYATDLLLSPPESLEDFLEAPTALYGSNRRNQMRKEIKFARTLEQSRIRELFLHEIFPEIDQVSLPIGAVHELSGHPNKVDMLFVCAIAKLRQARSIFEFGTYQGRTTCYLAEATAQTRVTTLDLPMEGNERYGRFNGDYFRGKPIAERIDQVFVDSRQLDVEPHRSKYDFIFVDGDHSYELVKNDTELAFQMLKPGGVIMWHDYAAKSERLVEYFQDFTTQTRPLFRIRRTCLLLHIDGVDPLAFEAAPLEDSLEADGLDRGPFRIESIYHH